MCAARKYHRRSRSHDAARPAAGHQRGSSSTPPLRREWRKVESAQTARRALDSRTRYAAPRARAGKCETTKLCVYTNKSINKTERRTDGLKAAPRDCYFCAQSERKNKNSTDRPSARSKPISKNRITQPPTANDGAIIF